VRTTPVVSIEALSMVRRAVPPVLIAAPKPVKSLPPLPVKRILGLLSV
jgi:hypothetical protein